MTNPYGPTRSDLIFRLGFSVAGLTLTGSALLYRGLPTGPGGWEAIGIATLFFGGTLIWTLRTLINRYHSERAAAHTSTSTTNSGRVNPDTMTSVELGSTAWSATNASRAAM